MRPARRGSGISPGLARSALGQASSNDAGGGSAGFDRRHGGRPGAKVRRQQIRRQRLAGPRLRRARALFATSMKTANCASVSKPAVAVRGASAPESDDHAGQPRSATAAVPPEQKPARPLARKGPEAGSAAGKPPPAEAASRVAATGGTGRTAASPRASGTPEPSRRAMFFNSRTVDPEPKHDHAGADADHAGDDQRIAGTEFWTPIPYAIASRPAKTRPIPATNITNIIELTPQPRPKRSQAAHATIPSYCRAPPTANCITGFRNSVVRVAGL